MKRPGAFDLDGVVLGRNEAAAAHPDCPLADLLVAGFAQVDRAARAGQQVRARFFVQRVGGDRCRRAAFGQAHGLEVEAVLAHGGQDHLALGLGAVGAALDDLAHVPVDARLDAVHHA